MPPLLALTLLAVGALALVLAIPLWMQRIPMNRFYGFRTPRTTHDERVWYPTNRVMGRNMALGSIAMMLAGLGDLVLGPGVPETAWVLMAVLPLLAGLLHGFVWASAFVGDLDAGRSPTAAGLPTEEAEDGVRGRSRGEREHT